jgi:hypothetical protein
MPLAMLPTSEVADRTRSICKAEAEAAAKSAQPRAVKEGRGEARQFRSADDVCSNPSQPLSLMRDLHCTVCNVVLPKEVLDMHSFSPT